MPDYSCYITISNQLDVALTQVGSGTGHGSWASHPAQTISSKGNTTFQLKDSVGAYGSDGWVQYRVELIDVRNDSQKPVITVSFNDPTGNNDNQFSISANTATKLFNLTHTDFPKRDHPLTVTGTVAYADSIATGTAVASVKIPSPQLNVYNSKNVLNKAPNLEIWNNVRAKDFEDNDTPGIAGSYYPQSVDLTSDAFLNIVLNIDSSLVGVPFLISGSLGTDDSVLYNETPQFFTTTGTQTISMTLKPGWSSQSFPWGIAGDVVWHLTIDAAIKYPSIQLNSSRLEIYALTRTLLNFFNNQISVGALRAFILPARASGETDWVTYVIKATFANYGYVYDTDSGGSAFGCNGAGGTYKLAAWLRLRNTKSRVNCYDQAGIVQIGLGLGLNGSSTWNYMSPFGFITTTDLIGVGTCNNPFFTSNGTKAVIGNNDPQRTGFGNHAFVAVNSKSSQIADACAGPHLATERLTEYIDAAIQKAGNTSTTTTLYNTYPKLGPGTSANVQQTSGVVGIDNVSLAAIPSSTDQDAAGLVAASLQTVMDRAKVSGGSPNNASAISSTNVDLAKVHTLLTEGNGLPLLYHSYDVSPSNSHLTWVLKSEDKPTKIEIVVLSSADDAKAHFRNHLTTYEYPSEEIFTTAPGPIAKGELCLISPPEHRTYGRMVWVRGNVFAHVTGPMSVEELDDAYLKAIDGVFLDGSKPDSPGNELILLKPIVKGINAPKEVEVGQEFTVYASVEGSTHSQVYNGSNDTIVLLSTDTAVQTFNFRAEKAGKEKLVFAFAHTVTGLVATEEVEVTVV